MTYKLLTKPESKYLESVLRKADNVTIPFDPANTDYQEYLKWVSKGNTAEAAD